ncbi:MAG: NAD(P)H-hydrate dehydratase [Alphaproteobacteria bacterium]|nr:NAD(P)H-hydrate dehydratase [Alphaproteobacteria bacterium]
MSSAAEPLILPAEMATIDQSAIGSGIDGYRLMDAAGSAISACILCHYGSAKEVIVLCGPGNNGGDGYVAARRLRESGVSVTISSLVDPATLRGDAARARDDWDGPIGTLETITLSDESVVLDALFGGGLDRPIVGVAGAVIETINARRLSVVSADLPSGVSGASGEIFGAAFKAEHTVTFAAARPGHYLQPGAGLCGQLQVVDIGIPDRFLNADQRNLWLNGPAVWRDQTPERRPTGHKYDNGHLGIFSGAFARTGAARLAASAGLRAGAGLVTLLAPGAALASNAAHLTAIMLQRVDDQEDLDELLRDTRMNCFVLGPAFGVGQKAREFVHSLARCGNPLVLDADGLTAFSDQPQSLGEWFAGKPVRLLLTPHHGEFARLFPDLVADASLSKVDRARAAARQSNAVVLYKGPDTVVASPDGRAVINANAPAWLATAGSGDCLAGVAGGLIAKGMPVFEAAAAAAYLHGAAGHAAGQGLTAEDLPLHLPSLASLDAGDTNE